MWTRKKGRRAARMLIAYGRPHRRWLLAGTMASLGVVLFRLAMPWPLRGVVEVVFPRAGGEKLLVDSLPAWGDPVVWLGVFYFLFALGAGLFELIQRTNIMRFAANTVHDLRADAVRSVNGRSVRDHGATGDLIARIIGDSARIKAGMAGILVHVLQNGLIFLGVCAILLYISPKLGLISLAAGVAALLIGLRAAGPVAEIVGRQRRKEGHYADALYGGLGDDGINVELDKINDSSAKKEVRTTKLIALSSLAAHGVLAAAIALALWVGAEEVRSGAIQPGELFLFIAYALTVHRRMVQVGRQAARSGKVLACTDRIGALLRRRDATTDTSEAPSSPVPLTTGLTLEAVKLSAGRGAGRKVRLRTMDLSIEPGTRLAIIGHVGAGKSSLLRLLAGVETPGKGRVLWDGAELSGDDERLSGRVDYLPQEPVFGPTPAWRLIGLDAPDALGLDEERLLRRLGAWTVICGLPRRLEEKVSSHRLTPNERRLLRLAGILLAGRSSVWMLDSPLDGRGRRQAKAVLDEILTRGKDRTLVVALSQSIDLRRFDRVIVLRRGRVRFDGTPALWKAREAAVDGLAPSARAAAHGGGES